MLATTINTPASPAPAPSSVSSASSVVSSPLPPRPHAFALYCEGHRSPAIAARLGVSERTIRAWIQADLRQLEEQSIPTRRQLLQLAITRQLAIATAAWDAYRALPPSTRESHPAEGARYLRVAQAAYREIDRLQGLYIPAPAEQPPEVRIILERIADDDVTTTDLTHGLPTDPPPADPAETEMAAEAAAAAAAEEEAAAAAETAATTPPTAEERRRGAIQPLPPHTPNAFGPPRRERNRRPAPPLFAYRL